MRPQSVFALGIGGIPIALYCRLLGSPYSKGGGGFGKVVGVVARRHPNPSETVQNYLK